MAWCPRCDEVFPQGPDCPRCGTALVDDSPSARGGERPTGNLPQLKVPRRVRRAFDRMSSEPAPPRHLMALATAAILFAGGFLLGRLGSMAPDLPAIAQLSAVPLPLDLEGFVEYVARPPGPPTEPALVRHDLRTGQIDTLARFSLPFQPPVAAHVTTRVLSLAGGSALVLQGADDAFVGAFPPSRALPFWVEGTAAAWEDSSTLVVLRGTRLSRWTFDDDVLGPQPVEGTWSALHSTAGGAVGERVDGGRRLVLLGDGGPGDAMALPDGGRVLAVAPGAEAAVLERPSGASLWDGTEEIPIVAEGLQPQAAAFSPSGDRVAVTFLELKRGGTARAVLGVSDLRARVAFNRVATTDQQCRATPVWEGGERWVYVAPGNGSVYAVASGGGAVRGVHTRIVGCGLAWNV